MVLDHSSLHNICFKCRHLFCNKRHDSLLSLILIILLSYVFFSLVMIKYESNISHASQQWNQYVKIFKVNTATLLTKSGYFNNQTSNNLNDNNNSNNNNNNLNNNINGGSDSIAECTNEQFLQYGHWSKNTKNKDVGDLIYNQYECPIELVTQSTIEHFRQLNSGEDYCSNQSSKIKNSLQYEWLMDNIDGIDNGAKCNVNHLFDVKAFLIKNQNKILYFMGDSITEQQYVTIICHLNEIKKIMSKDGIFEKYNLNSSNLIQFDAVHEHSLCRNLFGNAKKNGASFRTFELRHICDANIIYFSMPFNVIFVFFRNNWLAQGLILFDKSDTLDNGQIKWSYNAKYNDYYFNQFYQKFIFGGSTNGINGANGGEEQFGLILQASDSILKQFIDTSKQFITNIDISEYLIFNVGAHWHSLIDFYNHHTILSKNDKYIQFRRAIALFWDCVMVWIKQSKNKNKSKSQRKVIFRSSLNGHTDCMSGTEIWDLDRLNNELKNGMPYNWDKFGLMDQVIIQEFDQCFKKHFGNLSEKNEIFTIMNISHKSFFPLMSLGHKKSDDCAHYCMPGPTYWWNVYLYHILLYF